MKIHILPKDLINQIAAGEVVERPMSVVKELVENSIDADAKSIVIEIENGGLNLVKVTDDGGGMNREDAQLSIAQHATSKIQSQEDLFNISTLGFRGEALASIAAVSEFNLVTQEVGAVVGTELRVLNGEASVYDIGAAPGTSISCRNLFYNVPARKKYMKTPVTEFNHIMDLFLSYCLGYPEIAWKLLHNSKVVYHFPSAERGQRIGDVLGDEVAANLLPVSVKLNGIEIKGRIGKPQIARNNRKLQYLFINRRPVNEFIVAKQVKEAFGTLLAKEMQPVYFLELNIENASIDVNVHPRKLEVRFSEPQLVYKSVYQAVAAALDAHELVAQVSIPEPKRFTPVGSVIASRQSDFAVRSDLGIKFGSRGDTSPSFAYKAPAAFVESSFTQPVGGVKSAVKEEEPFVPEYQILGQVDNAYILTHTEDAIKIYDQHASSERVRYEKLKREWEIGRLASQKMLLPQKIELTPAEARSLEAGLPLARKLGFDVEHFGGNSFAISAVPQLLVKSDVREMILEIIGELTEAVVVEDKIVQPIDNILKMMACKSAIKFGDALTKEGMEALINDLERLQNKYTCVHGRPTVIEFSFDELKKMFKRK